MFIHLECDKLPQLYLILCDPMDCSRPGSSVHGILQARILEWFATASSRGSSQTRDKPVSLTSLALAGEFFTTNTTRLLISSLLFHWQQWQFRYISQYPKFFGLKGPKKEQSLKKKKIHVKLPRASKVNEEFLRDPNAEVIVDSLDTSIIIQIVSN